MEKTKRFNLTTVLMLVLILLALALAFSGNALAFADDEVAFTVTSPLSFSDSSSNTTLEYDGYTWVYDSESKKGTLTIASAGLTVEPTDSDLPITFYVDAEVVLDGDLTLKGNNDGIRAEGDLTISGANDLTINATNGDGIYASGDITINGLNELNITAVYYGIMAGKNLYISDLDTIYIDADDAGIVTDSGSIYVDGITTMTIKSDNDDGIYSWDDCEISDIGSLEITTGGDGIYTSYGDVTISDVDSLIIIADGDGIAAAILTIDNSCIDIKSASNYVLSLWIPVTDNEVIDSIDSFISILNNTVEIYNYDENPEVAISIDDLNSSLSEIQEYSYGFDYHGETYYNYYYMYSNYGHITINAYDKSTSSSRTIKLDPSTFNTTEEEEVVETAAPTVAPTVAPTAEPTVAPTEAPVVTEAPAATEDASSSNGWIAWLVVGLIAAGVVGYVVYKKKKA